MDGWFGHRRDITPGQARLITARSVLRQLLFFSFCRKSLITLFKNKKKKNRTDSFYYASEQAFLKIISFKKLSIFFCFLDWLCNLQTKLPHFTTTEICPSHSFWKNITLYSFINRSNGKETARCRHPVDSLQLTTCFSHSKTSSVALRRKLIPAMRLLACRNVLAVNDFFLPFYCELNYHVNHILLSRIGLFRWRALLHSSSFY